MEQIDDTLNLYIFFLFNLYVCVCVCMREKGVYASVCACTCVCTVLGEWGWGGWGVVGGGSILVRIHILFLKGADVTDLQFTAFSPYHHEKYYDNE